MIYEKLSDAECYLYALTQDESGLDLAEFCLVDDTQEDGCFRAWPFQYAWWRTSKPKIIDAGARCLQEGTLVLTDSGWVEIQDITIGTLVLTHRNRWKPVVQIFDNGEQEVVEYKGQGILESLVATLQHKLWTRHARRGSIVKNGTRGPVMESPSFKTATEMRLSDLSQQLSTRIASPAAPMPALPWVDFLLPSNSKSTSKQNYVESLNNVNFMWLLGLYMAEGNIYIDRQFARVEFSLHREEVEYVQSKVSALGLNSCITFSKSDLSAKVRINSRPLVQWVQNNLSGYAADKQLPSWIYGLKTEFRKAIFDGMIYGDGHVRPTGRIEYSTVSRALALGIKILGQSLGYYTSIYNVPERTNMIDGRVVHSKKAYVVSFDTKSRNVVDDMGMHWVGLKSISPAGSARVFDIEVEDDHSYVAEGVICHNSIGKSKSIQLRAFAFPFIHPGDEMVVTAPEAIHLQAVTDNIEILYTRNKIARELLSGRIKHRPFHVNFANGARMMGRIPHRDGSGVKGVHPIWLEHDEAQDYGEAGWKEITPTVKEHPDARWRSHGVTRGVGDSFDQKITGKDSTWNIMRLPAMYRPTWTDEQRKQAMEEYGGYDSPDYRRNILGLPGDGNSPMFVLHRIMQCVDPDEESHYNMNEYYEVMIDEAMVREVESIEDLLEIPSTHLDYKRIWIGMDLGWTQAPSAIVVFAEVKSSGKDDKSVMKLLSKIVLRRVTPDDQVKVIMHLMDAYRPLAFALDSTGAGFVLTDELKRRVREDRSLEFMLDRIKSCQFSEKVIVGFDDSIEIDETKPDGYLDAAIRRPWIEASTDSVRLLIDGKRMILPRDNQIIGELQSTPKKLPSSVDAYGRSSRKQGQHILDAMRMACLTQSTNFIDELIASHRNIWVAPSIIMG